MNNYANLTINGKRQFFEQEVVYTQDSIKNYPRRNQSFYVISHDEEENYNIFEEYTNL